MIIQHMEVTDFKIIICTGNTIKTTTMYVVYKLLYYCGGERHIYKNIISFLIHEKICVTFTE